jgi:hypothetical protein
MSLIGKALQHSIGKALQHSRALRLRVHLVVVVAQVGH